MAFSCTAAPCGIVTADGLTAIDSSGGELTVNTVVAVMPVSVAVIVVVPYPVVVASPLVPSELLIVATAARRPS